MHIYEVQSQVTLEYTKEIKKIAQLDLISICQHTSSGIHKRALISAKLKHVRRLERSCDQTAKYCKEDVVEKDAPMQNCTACSRGRYKINSDLDF